jgi:hypothetical protein
MVIGFDESLAGFVRALGQAGVDSSEAGGTVIRDSRGRLSFVSNTRLVKTVIDNVSAAITKDLKPYISPIGPIADADSPGARRVLEDSSALTVDLKANNGTELRVKLLDRRAVGTDWLHVPVEPAAKPPRLVFASLKGGVGRSTALSVLAAELSEQGRTILVIDLDMEAPGIGSMLIEQDALPRFGTIDFFVENALKEIDDSFLLDCVGSSWLGGGRGRIDVVPSIGAISLEHPGGVLAKLARAYLDAPTEELNQKTFLTGAQTFLARLTSLNKYDAVLIDARAGLHETTAAPILGLGADVLLFGVNQIQTIIGFKVLLAQLAQFPRPQLEDDWRYRLRMIQAKALPDESSLLIYRSQMFDLFDAAFYQKETVKTGDLLAAGFRFSIDDKDAPHFPIPIFEDERYRLFDPVRDKSQLLKSFYDKGFGQFIEFAIERLQVNEVIEP